MRKNNILNVASGIIIFTCFFMLGIFLYWEFYPYKIFEAEQPFKVINKNVSVGESVLYRAKYCKYTDDIPVSVKRVIVDGYIYDLPLSTSSNFNKGCGTVVVSIPLILPDSLPKGEYRIIIIIEYKPNPIRTINYSFETEKFNII